MPKSLWISRLEIERSPGFKTGAFPTIEGLSHGLNLVSGSNGAGKTTMSKALRAVIWPGEKYPGLVSAIGEYEGQHYELNPGKQEERALPDLPTSTDDIYSLSIVDLLQSTENAEKFANQIKTEIAYGIDVQKALRDSGISLNRLTKESKAVDEAKEKIKGLETLYNDNQKIHQELEKKARLRDSESSLTAEYEKLKEAIQIKNNRAKLDSLKEEKESYDLSLAKITKDTKGLYQNYKNQINAVESRIATLQKRIESLELSLSTLEIPKNLISDRANAKNLRERVASIKELRRNLESANQEYIASKAACENWQEKYSWLNCDSDAENLQQKLGKLRDLCRDFEPVRGHLITAEQRLKLLEASLDEPFDPGRLEELQNSRQAILRCLGAEKIRKPWILVGIAMVGILLSILLKTVIFSAVALAAMVGYVWFDGKPKSIKIPNDILIKCFNRENEAVTSKECIDILEKIDIKITEQLKLQRNSMEKERAEDALRLASEQFDKWTEEYRLACSALGIDSNNILFEGRQFFNFSDQINQWAELEGKRKVSESLYQERKRQLEVQIKALSEMLNIQADDFGLTSEASTVADDLESYWKTTDERVKTQAELQETQNESNKAKEALDEFFLTCNIENQDEAHLISLCGQVDAYQKLCDSISLLESQCSCSDEILKLSEEELATLEKNSETLEQKIQEARDSGVDYAVLFERYKSLINSDDLANAKNDLLKASRALSESFKANAIASTVSFLGEVIETDSNGEKSKLLLEANTRLGEFTGGRYELRFSNEKFYVFDNRTYQTQTLDQLSSGTKVQVLISLRLAAISIQEKSASYPVFFDEILANSDDRRSKALGLAIAKIAESRQVFYFTAQNDEDHLMRECCSLSGVEYKLVNLDHLRGEKELESKPSLTYSPKDAVLYDFSCSYDSWMSVNKISGATLFDEIPSLSSWFLFFNMDDLKKAVEKSLLYVYEVRAADSFASKEIKDKINALEFARKAALVGRTKPVDVKILKDFNDSLSQKFWQKTIEFVETRNEVEGSVLIQAIEDKTIPRFSDEILNKLKVYLRDEKCLDERKSKPLNLLLDSLDNQGFNEISCNIAKRYLELFLNQ